MMLSEKPRSPVSEHRKVTKSAMEKKRRARINSSLTELKTILAGIMANKDERFEKMEKADILEMTVNYVRELQNKSSSKDCHIHADTDNYRTGVNSCISEVLRYVTASDSCDTDTKTKLLDHLANRVNSISTTAKSTRLNSPTITELSTTANAMNVVEPIPDINNNVNSANESVNHRHQTPITVITNNLPRNTAHTDVQISPSVISPAIVLNKDMNIQNVNYVSQTQTVVNTNVNQCKPQVIPIVSQTSPQVMSNVPLTIFVPANFCTNPSGTTCVIPITLANPGSDTGILLSPNTDSSVQTQDSDVARNIHSQTVDTGKVDNTFNIPERAYRTNSPKPNENQMETNTDISREDIENYSNNKESQQVFIERKHHEHHFKALPQNKVNFQTTDFSERNEMKRKIRPQYNRGHSVWRPW